MKRPNDICITTTTKQNSWSRNSVITKWWLLTQKIKSLLLTAVLSQTTQSHWCHLEVLACSICLCVHWFLWHIHEIIALQTFNIIIFAFYFGCISSGHSMPLSSINNYNLFLKHNHNKFSLSIGQLCNS